MCAECEKINELEVMARLSSAFTANQYLQELYERNYEQAALSAARLLLITGHLALLKDASIAPSPDECVAKCVESLQKEVDVMMQIFGQ
jgi:hypothetical protein